MRSGHIGTLASEEEETPISVEGGDHLVVFDPLDGSSNIRAGVMRGIGSRLQRGPMESVHTPPPIPARGRRGACGCGVCAAFDSPQCACCSACCARSLAPSTRNPQAYLWAPFSACTTLRTWPRTLVRSREAGGRRSGSCEMLFCCLPDVACAGLSAGPFLAFGAGAPERVCRRGQAC